jgi:hypothetical protein
VGVRKSGRVAPVVSSGIEQRPSDLSTLLLPSWPPLPIFLKIPGGEKYLAEMMIWPWNAKNSEPPKMIFGKNFVFLGVLLLDGRSQEILCCCKSKQSAGHVG